MTPDLINGLFEVGGAILLLGNVRAISRDKEIKGVCWGPTVFFAVWGIWNLFYYPSLEQWFSFAGGLAIVAVNLVWVAQIAYYRMTNPRGSHGN